MWFRTEERRLDKTCITIGAAHTLLRQRLAGQGGEHERSLLAALDAAAVQLFLLVTGAPIQLATGGAIDSRLLQLDRDAAISGVRILGWNQIIRVRAGDLDAPLILAPHFAYLVEADDELLDGFQAMSKTWDEFIEAHHKGEDSARRALSSFIEVVWNELDRSVYRKPPTVLDTPSNLAVTDRLATLQDETEPYFMALVGGIPMPSVRASHRSYFEQFVLFRQQRRPKQR